MRPALIFSATLLFEASTLVAASKSRLCTEVCWTHHINDDGCPLACQRYPGITEADADSAERCILSCGYDHTAGSNLNAYTGCRTACYDKYFGGFLGGYSHSSKRSTGNSPGPSSVSAASAPTKHLALNGRKIPAEPVTDYRKCMNKCAASYPEHGSQRVGCSRACHFGRGVSHQAKQAYKAKKALKARQLDPPTTPEDWTYDDDIDVDDETDLPAEELICMLLCAASEGNDGCVPDCLNALAPRIEQIQMVVSCTMFCLGGSVGAEDGTSSPFMLCVQSCLFEFTDVPSISDNAPPTGLDFSGGALNASMSNSTFNSTRAVSQYSMGQANGASPMQTLSCSAIWVLVAITIGLGTRTL